MAAIKVYAQKDVRSTQAVLQVYGDTRTQYLRFIVDRFDGGVDLYDLSWLIKIRNADGVEDAHRPAMVEIGADRIMIDWLIRGVATSAYGMTEYELNGVHENAEAEAVVWRGGFGTIMVSESISPNLGEDVEGLSEVEQLIVYVDGKLQDVIAAGDAALNAATKVPYISENGTWMVWDPESLGYIDTGVGTGGPQGDQGVSVTKTVVDENGHLMVSFSDGNVVDAGKVKGDKGDKGDQGISVTESTINSSGHLIITLSNGTTIDTGDAKGPQGTPGTGVTILGSYATEEELKAAHPTGTAGDAYLIGGNLYVWSASTSEWENVGNIQGPQGEPGYTPVRGTDYWTDADKAEIKGYVDEAILGGAW